MTSQEAVKALRALAKFYHVEDPDNEWDVPEWTWTEQQELSQQLAMIADALDVSKKPKAVKL